MATVTGIITATGQEVEITLPTIRIPELNAVAPALELVDKLAVFDESEQRTSYSTLSMLRTLILTGGGGTAIPPVLAGNKLEIIVQASNIDGDDPEHPNRVLVPELENKTYSLRRTGVGDILTTEFNNLPSGGFELIDDEVELGNIFIAEIYTAGTGTPGGGLPTTAASFLDGIAVLADDTTLSTVHRNKLLHASSPSKNIIVTLEDIAVLPANTLVCVETTLSGVYKTQVQTQGGQLIYFNNRTYTNLWLGQNEFLVMYRANDGYYVVFASESITNVGKPFFDYIERPNSLKANGGLILRSAEPRLFALVSANSEMYVSETAWQADALNQGKFSLGTITSGAAANFRMPDHQNMFYRGLNNLGGADIERPGNTPGLRQADKIGPLEINIPRGDAYNGDSQEGAMRVGGGQGSNTQTPIVLNVGGTETRGKNVGFIPYISS